jgi:hypothetical protein
MTRTAFIEPGDRVIWDWWTFEHRETIARNGVWVEVATEGGGARRNRVSRKWLRHILRPHVLASGPPPPIWPLRPRPTLRVIEGGRP